MSREHFVGGILILQHPVAQKTWNLQDLIKSCSALTTDALVIPSFPRVNSPMLKAMKLETYHVFVGLSITFGRFNHSIPFPFFWWLLSYSPRASCFCCLQQLQDVGTFSLSLIDICTFCHSCIQMGGWGDVNIHCIASSEDVVTLKIGVAYKWGGGGMLTFIALRHQKMLLR